MSKKIEWNPDHKSADEQQNAFIDRYLSWSPKKKWEYLMELASQGISRSASKSREIRRIEWK